MVDEINLYSSTDTTSRDDDTRNANVNSPPHYLKGRKELLMLYKMV